MAGQTSLVNSDHHPPHPLGKGIIVVQARLQCPGKPFNGPSSQASHA
ncbi:MAG: hypothetical protein WCH65_06530 [bacterium]